MSEAEQELDARRWLRFADEDLESATTLLDNPSPLLRNACLLAQQAAEKAVKAILILEDVRFPRTHDIELLITLLPERVKMSCPDASELSQWAVESRYPGDWPEPRIEDASRAVLEAKQFVLIARDFIS